MIAPEHKLVGDGAAGWWYYVGYAGRCVDVLRGGCCRAWGGCVLETCWGVAPPISGTSSSRSECSVGRGLPSTPRCNLTAMHPAKKKTMNVKYLKAGEITEACSFVRGGNGAAGKRVINVVSQKKQEQMLIAELSF